MKSLEINRNQKTCRYKVFEAVCTCREEGEMSYKCEGKIIYKVYVGTFFGCFKFFSRWDRNQRGEDQVSDDKYSRRLLSVYEIGGQHFEMVDLRSKISDFW